MDPGESIYNLIPQPVQATQKAPLYRSKHPHDLPATFSTFGLTGTSKPGYGNVAGTYDQPTTSHVYTKPHATFGKHGAGVKAPSDILPKGTGKGGGAVALTSKVDKFNYTDVVPRKVGLPSKQELDEHRDQRLNMTKEPKNYITANAVENILSVPTREPEPIDWTKKPRCVDVVGTRVACTGDGRLSCPLYSLCTLPLLQLRQGAQLHQEDQAGHRAGVRLHPDHG